MEKRDAIALLKDTAQLLELHGASSFRIRHYSRAALQLERLGEGWQDLSPEAMDGLEGLDKSTLKYFQEISTTGTLRSWEELSAITPQGVREMLLLQGIGPRKANALWKGLGIESLAELQCACENNRVMSLPGFGEKTQATIHKSLAFRAKQAGLFHYAHAIRQADALKEQLKRAFPHCLISLVGALRRKMEVVDRVDMLLGTTHKEALTRYLNEHPLLRVDLSSTETLAWCGWFAGEALPLNVFFCVPDEFYGQLVLQTGSAAHLALRVDGEKTLKEVAEDVSEKYGNETAVYTQAKLPYIPPELREGCTEMSWVNKSAPKLLEMRDLKGVLHTHTTYSDGLHALEEMALYCRDLGYEYLGITDHSQYASYANGLKPGAVARQHCEIDRLNDLLAPFRVFKGIEADVLGGGGLDYADDVGVLESFDFVIAAVHSGADMTSSRATERLIKAVQNPYTTILAHLTNRLLLKREGFSIDYKAVIDACAECGVIIEINSNPWRLELDWRWLDYALSKGVWISINPDAHEKEAIQSMYYGVCIGRKGGLTQARTFNALSREAVTEYFWRRKRRVHS